MTITLKHDAECAECKAILPAGTKARWYRDGSVYGNECHRWRVNGLSASQQERLAKAASAVLKAARGPVPIPARTVARIAALGQTPDKTMSLGNYSFLIAELEAIREELHARS